jgi:hypothetical protein
MQLFVEGLQEFIALLLVMQFGEVERIARRDSVCAIAVSLSR